MRLTRLCCILFLAIVFALCVKPAHASGTVAFTGAGWKVQRTPYPVYANPAQAAEQFILLSSYTPDWIYESYTIQGGQFEGGGVSAVVHVYYNVNVKQTIASAALWFTGACPANSTGTSTCTCNSGWHPDSGATMCISSCPDLLPDGTQYGYKYQVDSVNPPEGVNPMACSANGCIQLQTHIVSVFGISQYSVQTTASQCPNFNQPANPPVTVLTVTFVPQNDISNTKYDDVVAKAAALDESKTAAKAAAAATAKAAADSAVNKLMEDVAAAQAAALTLGGAKDAVQSAATNFQASPTQENLNAYNTAISNYNTAQGNAQDKLTVAKASWKVASATATNAGAMAADSAAQNQKMIDLQAAINASTQAYVQAQIDAKKAGAADLQQKVTDANNSITNIQNSVSNNTTNITNVYTTIYNYNTTVNDTSAGTEAKKQQTPSIAGASSVLPTTPEPAASAVLDTKDLNKEATQKKMLADLDRIASAVSDTASAVSAVWEAVPAAEAVPHETPTFDIVPVSFASSSVCPAGIPLTFYGHTYSISYQPLCDVAALVRPIFLAIAAITAAFIFASGLVI